MNSRKPILLVATFIAFILTSFSALAVNDSSVAPMGTCTYKYTHCSNTRCTCSGGVGAKGEHVYSCSEPPYTRTQSTCCNCN